MLIHKEDIALLQGDFFFSDEVCNSACVDVHNFHEVVSVLGKIDKTRVSSKIKGLIFQQFFDVDDKALRFRIIGFFQPLTVQNIMFFFRERAERFD